MTLRIGRSAPGRAVVLVAALLLAGGALGCGASGINLSSDRTRDLDGNEHLEDEYESVSPNRYADRWGEPDIWRDEKVGSELQSTMIWRCIDGDYREMVWRLRDPGGGRQFWVLISDITREGDCP